MSNIVERIKVLSVSSHKMTIVEPWLCQEALMTLPSLTWGPATPCPLKLSPRLPVPPLSCDRGEVVSSSVQNLVVPDPLVWLFDWTSDLPCHPEGVWWPGLWADSVWPLSVQPACDGMNTGRWGSLPCQVGYRSESHRELPVIDAPLYPVTEIGVIS